LPQVLVFITLIQSRAISILQHSVGGSNLIQWMNWVIGAPNGN